MPLYLNTKICSGYLINIIKPQYWKFATVPLGTGVAMSLGDNLKLNIGTQWSWVNTDRAASYNMTLSEKRGKAVSDYLVKIGISVSRIHTKAFGETQLVNNCTDGVSCTKEEHAANRRVEATIVIWKEK